MNRNKNQKRKAAQLRKNYLTTLKFQAEWGFKQLKVKENALQQQPNQGLILIEQLDLSQNLLDIQ